MNQTTSNSLDQAFWGHPKGLQTLFMTEMWERMSYYGMRALLVLFMTASMQDGGLEMSPATAVAIYGLYTASTYFMGLPGGWIADRLIGAQKAIWYGGIVIMCGHLVLAIPSHHTFFIGLILVVLGTGLLKPNISAAVGQLYSLQDERRDSGYALYYMGINIGATIGFILCGYLAENFGWHWAFGAAAVGMGLGLAYFRATSSNLCNIGASALSPVTKANREKALLLITCCSMLLVVIVYAAMTGSLIINVVELARYVAVALLALFALYFSGIYFFGKLNDVEKKGMWALLLVCIATACFWSGFEQAGSTLNLFARDYTDRVMGGFEIPTTWFLSSNSFFIILFSPFFAALWIQLGMRLKTPSYAVKCAIGLITMALGFLVMYFAAKVAASGLKAAPYFLILTYLMHTLGELILSPIALSAISKLSPKRFLGQMMGLFILTYSIGSIIAGLLAGNFDPDNVGEMPGLYLQIVIFSVAVGAIILILGLVSRHWEKQVEDARDVS